MTYFDPSVYNEQNLHETDKQEIEFWREMVEDALTNTRDDIAEEFEMLGGFSILKKLCLELIDRYIKEFSKHLENYIFDYVIGIIDNYSVEEND